MEGMTDLTEEEVIDLLDLMVSTRYPGYDAIDFLSAHTEGVCSQMFPDSHDLQVLADALEEPV